MMMMMRIKYMRNFCNEAAPLILARNDSKWRRSYAVWETKYSTVTENGRRSKPSGYGTKIQPQSLLEEQPQLGHRHCHCHFRLYHPNPIPNNNDKKSQNPPPSQTQRNTTSTVWELVHAWAFSRNGTTALQHFHTNRMWKFGLGGEPTMPICGGMERFQFH